MRELPEVANAKSVMTEAIDWSVMKWLREKKKVRKIADQANAALDKLRAQLQTEWDISLQHAYRDTKAGKNAGHDPFLKHMLHADDAARRAREDAENTFDEAERELSTRLAREGCRKAIHSWEMHEKAIHLAESVTSKHKAAR